MSGPSSEKQGTSWKVFHSRCLWILARKNITLVKLPGYSYDINPIEKVFGQAKAIARFTPGFLKENTMLAIVSAFEQISPLNVRHFYQRSWRVLL